MNRQILLLVLFIVPVMLSTCPQPDCSEIDCHHPFPGLSIGDDGCAQCDCSKHAIDADCPNMCPADCGQKREDNGCLKCICSNLPQLTE